MPLRHSRKGSSRSPRDRQTLATRRALPDGRRALCRYWCPPGCSLVPAGIGRARRCRHRPARPAIGAVPQTRLENSRDVRPDRRTRSIPGEKKRAAPRAPNRAAVHGPPQVPLAACPPAASRLGGRGCGEPREIGKTEGLLDLRNLLDRILKAILAEGLALDAFELVAHFPELPLRKGILPGREHDRVLACGVVLVSEDEGFGDAGERLGVACADFVFLAPPFALFSRGHRAGFL